jgi:hypothetical protein
MDSYNTLVYSLSQLLLSQLAPLPIHHIHSCIHCLCLFSFSLHSVSFSCPHCYELSSTPSIFPFYLAYPTPVTTQLTLPITSDLPEDITKALKQLYANLTHFLASHHHTPNFNLLSHQPNGPCPLGSRPHPHSALLLSHCCYPYCKDMTPPPLNLYSDLYLPSDMDGLPKIVTLTN